MFYWTPKRLKELKERGYKLKYYRYKPEWKNYTIEEEEEMKIVQSDSVHGKRRDY